MLVPKFLFILHLIGIPFTSAVIPVILNTWKFTNATTKAWSVLKRSKSTLDALVEGCSVCEREQCDGTVGYGGSPDENGETTLDAMIMDGETMNVGAVAGMRRIKDAIAVARHVLENTEHTFIVGDLATSFAEAMGFKAESLVTPKSKKMWKDWRDNNCQPNFWTNVLPNPNLSCGPYRPIPSKVLNLGTHNFGSKNHDTIGMIVIDKDGKVAAGTSTNGAKHKIPGRVGDSPIVGSGAYAEKSVGAAVATGDGDVMMRFLPSFLAVEGLRSGLTPQEAARRSIERIVKHYPLFSGAVLVSSIKGEYSAACAGMENFPFSVCERGHDDVVVKYVGCI